MKVFVLQQNDHDSAPPVRVFFTPEGLIGVLKKKAEEGEYFDSSGEPIGDLDGWTGDEPLELWTEDSFVEWSAYSVDMES